MQKLFTFFFSKNISIYAVPNDQNFLDTLTNHIASFEQLGPVYYFSVQEKKNKKKQQKKQQKKTFFFYLKPKSQKYGSVIYY